MMAHVHRIICVTTATMLLSGYIQVAAAQEVPLPNVPRIKYIEIFLEKLSGNDASALEHNRNHDDIVLELLIRFNDRAKEDKRCILTHKSKYFGYFKYSIRQLQEKLGRKDGRYYPVDLYLTGQVNGWIHGHGCGSGILQSTLKNAVQYALGAQGPVPYELREGETVFKIGSPFIDYYCGILGRYDPACANLVGFMKGRPEPSCSDGLMIPAAPEPPKVVRCIYEMPISKDSRRYFNRFYTYWYQRVPNNFNSLRVYGVDQFSSIAPVAVERCPTDHRAAAKLSGDRHGVPIAGFPGEITGMPEPPRSVRSPRCEEVRVTQQPTVTPQNFEEGDYVLLQKVAPVYPSRALSRGMVGKVEVSFTISVTGAVTDPIVVSSTSKQFERPAVMAVLKYRYKPRIVNGEAVEVIGVTETVEFAVAMRRR